MLDAHDARPASVLVSSHQRRDLLKKLGVKPGGKNEQKDAIQASKKSWAEHARRGRSGRQKSH
jgi:hypothetical protein